MTHKCLWAVAWWLMTSAALAQTANDEGPKQQASAHFRQGVELFREGAYRAALVELRRAYDVLPDYRVLYNIGQTELQVGAYVEAIRDFESYLQKGGLDISDERRASVEQDIASLRRRVGTIAITVNEASADVYLDGVRIGLSPLPATLPVSAGRHHVRVNADDGATATAMVDVAGGDFHELELRLLHARSEPEVQAMQVARPRFFPTAQAEAAEPVAQLPSDEDSLSRRDCWGLGLLGTGGAAGIGAAVIGLGFALPAYKDYRRALDQMPADMRRIDSAHDNSKRFSRITDGLAAGAVVLGVAGLVLMLVDEEPPMSGERARAKVDVGVSRDRLMVAGAF
jgi:tetratricopeptide (TPR) repeat protein